MKYYRKTLKDIFIDSNYECIWKNHNIDYFIPHGYDEMIDIYKRGYKEGIRKLQSELNKFKENCSKKPYYDVIGAEIDIGKYLDNIPECMIDYEKVKHGSIDIYVDIEIHASTNTDTYLENMGTLLGIVDEIESRGIVVKLYGYMYSDIWDDTIPNTNCTICTVIDINHSCLSDTAIIAHPSFVRRILYSAQSNYLGYRNLNGRRKELKEDTFDGIVIPGMEKRFSTTEDREEYLLSFFN